MINEYESMPSKHKIMKHLFFLTPLFAFTLSCTTQREIPNVQGGEYYPYMEDGRWGYTNDQGEIVIDPQFDSVEFFSQELAVVGQDGKYGYLNRKGEWHLRPRYDKALKFDSRGSIVTKGRRNYDIDTSGKKVKGDATRMNFHCGTGLHREADPLEYVVEVSGSYEVVFDYLLVTDLESGLELTDTTEMSIDTVYGYSRSAIILEKDGKSALYKVLTVPSQVRGESNDAASDSEYLKQKHDQFNFVYDEVEYFGKESSKRYEESTLAKVRIGDKWGVINDRGDIVVPIEYLDVDISDPRVALVRFAHNKQGYRSYNQVSTRDGEITQGKEYFLR